MAEQIRFKCLTNLGIFKRWGEKAEDVKKDLSAFILERFGIKGQIFEVEPDKTHKYTPEKELKNEDG